MNILETLNFKDKLFLNIHKIIDLDDKINLKSELINQIVKFERDVANLSDDIQELSLTSEVVDYINFSEHFNHYIELNIKDEIKINGTIIEEDISKKRVTRINIDVNDKINLIDTVSKFVERRIKQRIILESKLKKDKISIHIHTSELEEMSINDDSSTILSCNIIEKTIINDNITYEHSKGVN